MTQHINKSKILLVITLPAMLFCLCNARQKTGINKQNEPINQVFASSRDSIVLKGNQYEEKLPYYSIIEIYRAKKLLFQYSNKDLEIEGYPNKTCIAHYQNDTTKNGILSFAYYIFIINDRPNVNRYLIIKTDINIMSNSGMPANLDSTYLLGITEANTAEIFGDIDYDGKFEIGGFKDSEYDYTERKDYYDIFEIAPNFPKDTLLRSVMIDFIFKKSK